MTFALPVITMMALMIGIACDDSDDVVGLALKCVAVMPFALHVITMTMMSFMICIICDDSADM